MTTIVVKILPDCIQNKWSDISSNKMYLEFGSIESKAALGMAIVESAAIVSIGKDLCKVCYTAEGPDTYCFRYFRAIGKTPE